MRAYEQWDDVYRKGTEKDFPWELGKPRPFLVDLIRKGKIKPTGKALDLCCGLGTNTMFLEESGFITSGIDISKAAISMARKRAFSRGFCADFIQGSALDLPYKDNEFDFILDIGCFHHMRPGDREIFLESLDRVLKPGGKYLVMAFSDRNGKAWNHFSTSGLSGIFSKSFRTLETSHVESVEGTGMRLWFRILLMQKPNKPVPIK